MATLSFSGKSSSSKNSPWHRLEAGECEWDDFPPRDREEIVKHYAPKIKILALRLKAKLPQNIELGELVSAGSMGLLEALGKFNPELGIKFDTYSENRIKGAMLDELRRLDWFSRGLRNKIKLLEKTIHDIEHETGQPATTEQIQKKSGLPEKDVHQGLEALQAQLCISLDAFHDNLSGKYDDKAQDEPFHSAVLKELIEKVALLIEELTPREKLVLSLYYGEELNMKETAMVMDITEGRVSQLHSQALGKLRKKFRSQYEVNS